MKEEIDTIFEYIEDNGGIIIENESWDVPRSHGSNNYECRTVKFLHCAYKGNEKIGTMEYEIQFIAYQV